MANSDKNIRITGNRGAGTGTNPKIVFTGASAGSSVITLEVLDDNTLSFTSNEGQVFSLDSNLSTGTIWSVNDVSGYPLLRADVGAASGATIRIAEGLGNVGIGETNPIHKFNVKGALAIGSTTTANYTVFRFPSAGNGQTYILPSAYPGTGVSVLQSDTSGNLLWVASGSGGGSGSVNSGTAGSVAYYPANGTAVSGTSLIQVASTGTAVSFYANVDIYAQNDLRLFNSGSSFFTGLQAGANAANYTLTLPTAQVSAGSSIMVIGSDGNMFFAAPGSGIAFSSATANTPIIRVKRPISLQFSAGFTPLAAGPDNVVIRVPESSTDGTTVLTYNLRRFQVRVETPSAGSSRLQLERSSTDTGTFTLAATGSSHIGGFGVTIAGAGIYLTSVTTFSGSLVTSGNLFRLNWTLLNATHANFSVNLLLEEV
jgi:hypothetical protein